MLKDVNDYNFDDGNKKGIIYYLVFILLVIVISFYLSGCSQPNKKGVQEICEDGYVYKVEHLKSKEIVIDNGTFKLCKDGKIRLGK